MTEQDNEFKLTLAVAKSYQEGTKKYVSGLASGVGVDRDQERMAHSAIDAFKKAIDEGIMTPDGQWSLVPLRSAHRTDWEDVLGWITKADVDADSNLWITAELDDDNPTAHHMFAKLSKAPEHGRPTKLGFSVGGKIRKASREWDNDLQRSIRVIEDVSLREVSVVGCPAYPTAYVEALTKSVNWDDVPLTAQEILMNKENDMPKKEEVITEDLTKTEALEEPITKTEEIVTEPVQAEVPENTEVVTKNEEVPTDPQFDLASILASIQTSIGALNTRIDGLSAPIATSQTPVVEQAVDSNKSQTKEETDITKSTDDDLVGRLQTVIDAALTKFKEEVITPLQEELTTTKSVVADLGNVEIDKSLSVMSAKESTDKVENFKKSLAEHKDDPKFNPLAQAVSDSVRY